MISSSILKPLITYGLYNIIIGIASSEIIHYDEIIYFFDNRFDEMNETFFVTQILPRLIRLLALIPQTAIILSAYFQSKIKYIDILIQYRILNDRKRLIKYNSKKNYHAYVVYSTSSPRSDLILLHQILIANQISIRIWCFPGTHIIEIGQKTMTTNYYEISLQLKFNYWLVSTRKTNQINMIDFRYLIMKVFTELDD